MVLHNLGPQLSLRFRDTAHIQGGGFETLPTSRGEVSKHCPHPGGRFRNTAHIQGGGFETLPTSRGEVSRHCPHPGEVSKPPTSRGEVLKPHHNGCYITRPCCITAAIVTQPHTHAHICIWRGRPTVVSIPHGEFSRHSALPTLCFTHCSPVNAILPQLQDS